MSMPLFLKTFDCLTSGYFYDNVNAVIMNQNDFINYLDDALQTLADIALRGVCNQGNVDFGF